MREKAPDPEKGRGRNRVWVVPALAAVSAVVIPAGVGRNPMVAAAVVCGRGGARHGARLRGCLHRRGEGALRCRVVLPLLIIRGQHHIRAAHGRSG